MHTHNTVEHIYITNMRQSNDKWHVALVTWNCYSETGTQGFPESWKSSDQSKYRHKIQYKVTNSQFLRSATWQKYKWGVRHHGNLEGGSLTECFWFHHMPPSLAVWTVSCNQLCCGCYVFSGWLKGSKVEWHLTKIWYFWQILALALPPLHTDWSHSWFLTGAMSCQSPPE